MTDPPSIFVIHSRKGFKYHEELYGYLKAALSDLGLHVVDYDEWRWAKPKRKLSTSGTRVDPRAHMNWCAGGCVGKPKIFVGKEDRVNESALDLLFRRADTIVFVEQGEVGYSDGVNHEIGTLSRLRSLLRVVQVLWKENPRSNVPWLRPNDVVHLSRPPKASELECLVGSVLLSVGLRILGPFSGQRASLELMRSVGLANQFMAEKLDNEFPSWRLPIDQNPNVDSSYAADSFPHQMSSFIQYLNEFLGYAHSSTPYRQAVEAIVTAYYDATGSGQ